MVLCVGFVMVLRSVRRRRLLEPKLLAQGAFGLLAAAHRFGDQRVGQNQPRFGDLLDRQEDIGCFAALDVVAPQVRTIAIDTDQDAAKALAAIVRNGHLDLDLVAGVAFEVGAAHQRPVDPRRGNFQPVGAIDRIGHVHHRRQGARNLLAILDQHRAVRPLRHDLHRGSGFTGYPYANQPVTHAVEHRLGDSRHARSEPRLDHEARFGQVGIRCACGWLGHQTLAVLGCGGRGQVARSRQVIKKSGSRRAHSLSAIGRYEKLEVKGI